MMGIAEYTERIARMTNVALPTDDDRPRNDILAVVFGIASRYSVSEANKIIVEMDLARFGIKPIHEFGPDDPNIAIAIAA